MRHEGKILEMLVSLSDKKFLEIVELSGISKSKFYNMYDMPELKETDKKKLIRAGINVDEVPESLNNPMHETDPENDPAVLKATLEILKQNYQDLKAHIASLERNNLTLNKLVNKQLD